MSRLLLQAYLTAARLRVQWTAGLSRGGSEILDESLSKDEDKPVWGAAIRALADQVRLHGWKDFELRAFLGDENVRYAMLPSLEVHLGTEELSRLAHSVLLRTYGESARDWTVRITAAGRRSVLAAAIESTLLEALRGVAAAAGGRLRSVRPAFLELGEAAGAFAPRADAWILALEPSAAVAALWEVSDLRAVRVRRAGGGMNDLGAWMERERLRAGSEVRNVLVCGESPASLVLPPGWSLRESSPKAPLLMLPRGAPEPAAAVENVSQGNNPHTVQAASRASDAASS